MRRVDVCDLFGVCVIEDCGIIVDELFEDVMYDEIMSDDMNGVDVG